MGGEGRESIEGEYRGRGSGGGRVVGHVPCVTFRQNKTLWQQGQNPFEVN